MSYLATLKRDGDSYVTASGCYYDGNDAEALLAIEVFGFCGCGCPDEALKFMHAALHLVADMHPTDGAAFDDWWPKHRARADALFHGDGGIEYFTYYHLAERKLTEHGSSVPGWLTELGRSVLVDLDEYVAVPAPQEPTT